MSGGRFHYNQNRIEDIVIDIEVVVAENEKKEFPLSEKTIQEFKYAIRALRIAAAYAQRIDLLLSGDDGEDTFHERLKAEMVAMNAWHGTTDSRLPRGSRRVIRRAEDRV